MPTRPIPAALAATAATIRDAIARRRQLVFGYEGFERVACPHSLGWKDDALACFAWQVSGGSESGLPPGGEWRCFHVGQMEQVTSREGPWQSGPEVHLNATCIDTFIASVEAG